MEGGGCYEIQRGGRFVLTSCNKCHLSVARPRAAVTRRPLCSLFRHASRNANFVSPRGE